MTAAPTRARFKFDRGTSRKVHAELCAKCGRPILVGLDDDRCAMTARVNPWPLNALGEASALLADRATYELRRIGGEYVLDWRGAERISAHPAGSDPRLEVMGAHECGPEDPANMRTMRISETQTDNATVADDDRPPF